MNASVDRPVRGGTTGTPMLICFAHAGGSARAAFRSWRRQLRPDMEVCPVERAGSGARVDEIPARQMSSVVADLAATVRSRVEGPYALLGHSFGALVAYEVARKLSGPHGTAPSHLYVSAHRSPDVAVSTAKSQGMNDDQLLASLARLGGIPAEILRYPSLQQMHIPAIRAELTLSEEYRSYPSRELICPITALVGDTDPLVTPAQMEGWRGYTKGPFDLKVFSGGHFYLNSGDGAVLSTIRAKAAALQVAG